MAKIFQLELFIKEMSLWTLPQTSEDHDETIVEVTAFDMKNVPINGYVFGENSTMNRGQNFLFTLGAMPLDENKVFFNVFKKAYKRDKNFLGHGDIPIQKIFGDLFSQVFKDANATTSSGDAFKIDPRHANAPIVASQQNPQNATQSSQVVKQNPQVTKQDSQTVKQSPSQTKANAVQKSNPVPATQGPSQTKPNPQDPQKQTQAAKQSPSKNDPQDPNQGDPNVASSNNPQDPNNTQDSAKGDPQANIPAIKNLKTFNIAATTQGSPASALSKDVYPIIGSDSKQWGTICILMRLTCFGQSNAHPILIHQNHKEIILQNTPKSATYKCVSLKDSDGRQDPRRIQQPMNRNNAVANMASSSSSSTTSSSTSSNNTINRTTASKQHFRRPNTKNKTTPKPHFSKLNLKTNSSTSSSSSSSSSDATINPCGPPGSPSGQYEEFTAEINDNMLCVRVPKNVGTVKRIYDSKSSSTAVRSIENTYRDRRKIPIIRGNRKYPAHYGTVSSLPSPRNSASYNSINENRICKVDNMSCPSNVQITRRNNDPTRDVFLLNIGKDARNGNGIQLEMKTPKNPLTKITNNKQTTSVQTYDDEFVSGVKRAGKKGGKKGKK